MSWRERFGMQAAPLPRGAAGETFFDQDPHYQRLARAFAWLAAEPGIGVLTGEPGVGKTAAMRHLCRQLPGHEHRVVYLCDCAVKPLDLYRMLAAELGLRPGPRAQIVADIKRALVSLVDMATSVQNRIKMPEGFTFEAEKLRLTVPLRFWALFIFFILAVLGLRPPD